MTTSVKNCGEKWGVEQVPSVALVATINKLRKEHEERWRASARIYRMMVREQTISRFLIAAMVVMEVLELLGWAA